MLKEARNYWLTLKTIKKISDFIMYPQMKIVVIARKNSLFTENSSYASSPYSASKASSDVVRAWYRTYKLPIIITNCSNNYGPYQFPKN